MLSRSGAQHSSGCDEFQMVQRARCPGAAGETVALPGPGNRYQDDTAGDPEELFELLSAWSLAGSSMVPSGQPAAQVAVQEFILGPLT